MLYAAKGDHTGANPYGAPIPASDDPMLTAIHNRLALYFSLTDKSNQDIIMRL